MAYYVRKVAGFLVTLFLVSLLTFLVFQILPGDPARVILGVDADPLQLQQLREELGMDRPAPLRFLEWLGGVLRGDLGTSYRYHQPVSALLGSALGVTAQLAVYALVLTAAVGLPVGIWLAHHSKKKYALPVSLLSQLGLSVPSFCVGVLLVSVFSVGLGWFPSMGYTPFFQDPLACVKSLTLPAVSIAFGSAAVLIRYVQASILEQEGQEYVKTARSKGVPGSRILRVHVLRNSLIPVLTVFGMTITDVLGGSILVENLFSLPGIGRLIATSINSRDLPLIQGLVLYLAALVVVCNFGVDLFYSVVDPRIRRK